MQASPGFYRLQYEPGEAWVRDYNSQVRAKADGIISIHFRYMHVVNKLPIMACSTIHHDVIVAISLYMHAVCSVLYRDEAETV